jgi:2-(1,2-epoxy-1,2-dihydrophenyl)acetyl-CoA isomerase
VSEIEWQVADGVGTLVLNRPHRKNAIDTASWQGLQIVLESILDDPAVRVLVVRGAGTDFSAGADISGGSSSHPTQLERMEWFNRIISAFRDLPIPTIAQVDGVAFGVGMNIAIGCDFVVASDRARFSEVFVKRALSVDGGGSWLLPRLVGMRQAKRLCLLAEVVDAKEAERIGLITSVAPADELEAEVTALAAKLAALPRLAVIQSKRLLDDALTTSFEQALENEARAQAINVASQDFSDAMAEFRRAAAPRTKPIEAGADNG